MDRVAVLIPCYNEEKTIAKVVADARRVLLTIFSLYRNYRPMNFFGLLTLVLAVLGVGFLIPVLVDFSKTGLVDRFPTLIVCCFVLPAALISFFTGLILSSMERNNRRDFEVRRNNLRKHG